MVTRAQRIISRPATCCGYGNRSHIGTAASKRRLAAMENSTTTASRGRMTRLKRKPRNGGRRHEMARPAPRRWLEPGKLPAYLVLASVIAALWIL